MAMPSLVRSADAPFRYVTVGFGMARNQQTLVAAPAPGTAGIEFVCPACRATLGADHDGLRCSGCGAVHPVVNGQPDLRLRSPAPRSQTFLVGEVPVAPTVRPIRPTGPVHLTEE